MCYDVKAIHYAEHRRAKREGNDERAREIQKKLERMGVEMYHCVSGFSHPSLLIYGQDDPILPFVAQWGLIPHWTKSLEAAHLLWNKTINARGETIFEKPSFKDSAEDKRCLLYIDGFYEHHHRQGKSFPYFIQRHDKKPMPVAGLWSEWLDKNSGEIVKSFSMVTCEGNPMMAEIHNNPKLNGPRMPLIFENEDEADQWLDKSSSKDSLRALIKPLKNEILNAHTVKPIRGKDAVGNTSDAEEHYLYDELNTLF